MKKRPKHNVTTYRRTMDALYHCAYNGCATYGTERVCTYIDQTKIYKSKDGELFFCTTHIKEMVELYSLYKAIEGNIEPYFLYRYYDCLNYPNQYDKEKFKDDSFMDTLLYLIYDLDICIAYRQEFQRRLKPCRSEGHMCWIEKLKQLRDGARARYIDRGKKWNHELGILVDMDYIEHPYEWTHVSYKRFKH